MKNDRAIDFCRDNHVLSSATIINIEALSRAPNYVANVSYNTNSALTRVNSERRRTRNRFGSSNRWRHSQLFVVERLDNVAEDGHNRLLPLTVSYQKSLFRLRSIVFRGTGSSTGKYAAQ
jgi:hypothetical protein